MRMAEILFNEQKNGYDKIQVDSYIQKITEAYQTAYKEYQTTCEKYNNLMQDYKKLELAKNSGGNADADIIAKTLINSERLAKEIIDNAHSEEARIVDMTVQNIVYAYKTLENAMSEIQKFLAFSNSVTDQKFEKFDSFDSFDSFGSREAGGILNGIEINI